MDLVAAEHRADICPAKANETKPRAPRRKNDMTGVKPFFTGRDRTGILKDGSITVLQVIEGLFYNLAALTGIHEDDIDISDIVNMEEAINETKENPETTMRQFKVRGYLIQCCRADYNVNLYSFGRTLVFLGITRMARPSAQGNGKRTMKMTMGMSIMEMWKRCRFLMRMHIIGP